jgi:hypothetical protein
MILDITILIGTENKFLDLMIDSEAKHDEEIQEKQEYKYWLRGANLSCDKRQIKS